MKKIITLVIIAISFSSCFNNYFKVNTENSWEDDNLKLIQESGKKIIVHFSNAMKELTDPQLGSDRISGKLITYYAMAPKYTDPKTDENKNFKYKYKYRKVLFAEVHIYVNESYTNQEGYAITKENFAKSNIYHPNKGLSIFSHALGITIILGSLALLGLGGLYMGGVAIVTAMNCPQTYIETAPGQYQFIGGLFTGAVQQDLQRNDMLTLPDPSRDTIRIRIKGMQDETQFIDHANVRQIIHPEGTTVVADRKGDLFIIRHLKMPNEVKAGDMIDRSKTLLFRDGQNYGFHIADSSQLSHIQLKFSRKVGDKKAVLVVRMKNSAWGGYINNEMKKNSGNPVAIQTGYGSAIMGSAMNISLMTVNGWKAIDHFPPAGNTAERDLAMEIDLSEVEGKEVIIRMEAPYRFWDVDHVGLSYESIRPSLITDICRISATVNRMDFSGSIDHEDGVYLALEANDQLELEFANGSSPNQHGTITTYMLVAGGYYNLHADVNARKMTGEHRISSSFSLNQFSIHKYRELGFEH